MKKFKLYLAIYLYTIYMILGCSVSKTKLSKEELKWISVYKEGDILIFKSDRGDFDTTVIVKKELYYPEYNPVEAHGKYLPHWGALWYKNQRLNDHPQGYRLVTPTLRKYVLTKTGTWREGPGAGLRRGHCGMVSRACSR